MIEDIREILISKEQLMKKVKEIGHNISEDYKDKQLLIICILKGGVIFTADLIKEITIPVELDFLAVSSYGMSRNSSGVVRIQKDLESDVKDKHILIVEDIIDSGLTLKYIKELLAKREPASIRICTILNKPERRKANIAIDYVGFNIPDEFVVGYGLDYAEKYRNLPFVAVLKPEIYKA